jgi:hypothetical protein
MKAETSTLPAHIEDTVQAIAKLHADHSSGSGHAAAAGRAADGLDRTPPLHRGRYGRDRRLDYRQCGSRPAGNNAVGSAAVRMAAGSACRPGALRDAAHPDHAAPGRRAGGVLRATRSGREDCPFCKLRLQNVSGCYSRGGASFISNERGFRPVVSRFGLGGHSAASLEKDRTSEHRLALRQETDAARRERFADPFQRVGPGVRQAALEPEKGGPRHTEASRGIALAQSEQVSLPRRPIGTWA